MRTFGTYTVMTSSRKAFRQNVPTLLQVKNTSYEVRNTADEVRSHAEELVNTADEDEKPLFYNETIIHKQ